ncbi:MAG TPA: type II toxin-antitoxin system PemK/MazF family toxin [Verrucomicrobiae bacterium]|jgi:mRNA interferase MazF|nr:type II toxin-antitoxin system PemK/MazF family toxin [Verrucomicrobiae bacterium]
MKEGDIALATLPQSNGPGKNRPVVVLRRMPGFGDLLVCGVSSQLRQEIGGFDEIVDPSQPDFKMSGLKAASLIRLGFLAVLPAQNFLGVIGSISSERHQRLLSKLSKYLSRII